MNKKRIEFNGEVILFIIFCLCIIIPAYFLTRNGAWAEDVVKTRISKMYPGIEEITVSCGGAGSCTATGRRDGYFITLATNCSRTGCRDYYINEDPYF